MSNKNTLPILNRVLKRWLTIEDGLAPQVDCEACTLSRLRPEVAERWARYKCCTFQPFVANFYCGAMLEAGRTNLDLDSKRALLQPLGVVASASFRDLYESTPEDERGDAHLCSFYGREHRRCGVWEFRPAECSLYFCGSTSERRETWTRRAFELEIAIAQMALVHLGLSAREIALQVDHLNTPPADLQNSRDVTDLYRGAWAWAQHLSEEEISSWQPFDNPAHGE